MLSLILLTPQQSSCGYVLQSLDASHFLLRVWTQDSFVHILTGILLTLLQIAKMWRKESLTAPSKIV